MEKRCNLIVDSNSDITVQQIADNDLIFISQNYTEPDKEQGGLSGTDDLFQSISAHDFYEQIRNGAAPLTSQPSQVAFEQAFREALDKGIPAVYIPISSGLSGSYHGAQLALDRLKEELADPCLPIYIVDSLLASTALNLLVDAAIKKCNAGLEAQELVSWLEEARYHVQTIFSVDSLKYLQRGGRIPKSVAVVGGLLDAKPLLSFKLDGTLGVLSAVRGTKKVQRYMQAFWQKNAEPSQFDNTVAIGDADSSELADELAANITQIDSTVEILRSTIGPIVGCHVGPGARTCCFWGRDRRLK